MANCLVTGSNGFVGQNLVRRLLDLNHTPIVLVQDRNRKTNQSLIAEVERKGAVVYGDICDRELVRRVVSKYELDHIIHLAAVPIVKTCDADPWTAYQVNTMGSVVLYEAVREEMQRNKRLQSIIHMSTDKAYGDSSSPDGYTEDTPFAVTDTYCTSKACGDMIARSFAKTYKLPIMVVRCGNLYGPGDLNLSRLIPGTILRLLNGQSPVLFTDAAKMIREFIYVDDVVDAYLCLLKNGIPREAYNVGCGKPYQIGTTIQAIRDKVNPAVEIQMVPRDLFEINTQLLQSSKLRSLGWESKVELDEGLDRTIAWLTEWHKSTTRK